MPVEKKQKLVLIDYPDKGVNTNLDPDIKLEGETTLVIKCDSPTCDKSISWVLETSGENAENVPDDAFRVLILEEFSGAKHVFCSADCMRRAMKHYIAPLSPREKAKIEAHNASLTPTIQDAEVVASASAISQPDGFAGETSE